MSVKGGYLLYLTLMDSRVKIKGLATMGDLNELLYLARR